jgi:hypothetical protein
LNLNTTGMGQVKRVFKLEVQQMINWTGWEDAVVRGKAEVLARHIFEICGMELENG